MSRHRSFDLVVLSLFLRLYPRRFREAFEAEILDLYRQRRRAAATGERAGRRVLRLALSTWANTLVEAPIAWRDARQQPSRRHAPEDSIVSQWLYEMRLSARTLFVRQRAFALLCIVTLALGLGATTSIFSVVHGVLLAPLPYGEPDRIVLLRQTRRHEGTGELGGLNFRTLREEVTRLEVLAGYYDYRPEGIDLTGGDRAERLRILRVGAGYFEALGVEPHLGRTFLPAEEIPPGSAGRDPERFVLVTASSAPVVILSHGFWQRHFGGATDILGHRLELDEKPYTVVGVMPDRLGGDLGGAPDIWLPLDLAPGGVNVTGNQYLAAVGRLADGVSIEEARAELDHLALLLRDTYPNNEDLTLELDALDDVVVGSSRATLGVLLAAVGALLAIACINVANLFLGRSLGRRRELGLRAALGAGGRRLFAQTLSESFWIAAAGCGLGLLIAGVVVRWLVALRPDALPRYDALGLHLPVLAASAVTMVAAMLFFGMVPGLTAARADGRLAFTDRSALSHGDRRGRRLRDLSVGIQVALALVLLVAGGLLSRSFTALHDIDLGFDPEASLTFQLRLPDYAYAEPEQRIAFYDALFARLESVPEIAAAGATSKLPGTGHRNHWGFGIAGRTPVEGEPYPAAEIRCVAGDVLGALAVPRLTGRSVGQGDRPTTPRVVAINRSLAERYFDRDPVGQQLIVGGPPARTIVGVVADTRHDPREAAVPKIYVPQPQFATSRNWDLSFVVARRDEAVTWPTVRRQVEAAIAEVDPRLALYDLRTMSDVAAEPIARQHFAAQTMLVFAAFSLLLAVVGLFGTLAAALGQRRAEVGVRMALGADRGRILRSVLHHGLRICAFGLLLGVGGLWIVRRWLASVLHEVPADDPGTLLSAVAILVVAAGIAAAEPARRASRLDPAEILRGD